ncbi:MAG: response regulator [Planctomycetales bacterium]|nr:response regulator [Planctomycetales bacterium]NIP69420.1 response regulator [Planctomycetales bacterium]
MAAEQHQTVLVIEDSPEDFEATRRALINSGMRNGIRHCPDGDEALDYLFRRNQYARADSAPRPGIILLDLNMPGTDGREVLAEIKKDDKLRKIPVIVLTTSTDPRDIEACYAAGANSYIQKPVGLEGFMQAIQRLHDYWFEIVVYPKPDDSAA